jgi:Na+-transporting methylmalonyl-CoA/oxaloacetate decarboxylase beta subunit
MYSTVYPYLWSHDISNTPKAIEMISSPDGPTSIFITAKISRKYLSIIWSFAALFAFNIYVLSSKKGSR